MKKLFTFLFAIFLSIQLFAQSTPVGEFRVTDKATSLGFNIPAGTKVIALADSSYWVAKVGVLGSNSINSALSSFIRINKPETDPVVRAIVGVVKSNGTTISRVKSGTDIITINGDSLFRSGNIELVVKNDSSKLYELKSNKVTSLSSGSTDIQFPSAKNVYDHLATKIDTSTRAHPNGVATLDASGKVPLAQINDVLLGAVNYQSTWSPLTKTPTLPAAAAANKGWYYIATTDSTYLGILYKNKDWIVSNGTEWQKVNNNNLITSVFGRVGNVTANTYDITPTGNRGYITPADSAQLDNLEATVNAKVANSIANGVTTVAPAQDTVFHALSTKEPVINASTEDKYWRGDKSFQILNTAAVPELTNLYYTDVRVAANSAVAANTAKVSFPGFGVITGKVWGYDAHPTTTAGYGLPDYPTTVTAANITGILAVPKGGTGNAVITPGSIPQGNDVNPTSERTLAQLKGDIGAADNANYSNIKVETFAESTTGSSGEPHDLINYPTAAASVQLAVNGNVLEPGKYTVVNKTITVTLPVYQYDKVVATYGYERSGASDYATQWYGVERDITSSSADWTRIGYMSLHASLPVQSLLKGVVLNANRTVNYYLYPTDWSKKADGTTASVLTGADGNVMVRKDAPTYWKFEQIGNIQRVKCSIHPIPGFSKIDTWNVGAYEAYLSSGKLSSFKGVLPTTSRSETQFRADARVNGAGYNQLFNEPYAEILWMFVVEYATTNVQKAIAAADGNGYKTGGLGNGVTTAIGGEWNAYNGYSPFILTGSSDNLANGSGETSVTITNFGGAGVNRSFTVPRYRGIENLFGHIWKWVDGISFNHTATLSEVWIFDNPDLIADNTSVGARFAGYLPSVSGYTTNVLFGPRGDILPSAVGGDSSTYFADYFWTPGASAGWKALFSTATARYGVYSGLFTATTGNGAGDTSSFIGARLFAK